MSIETVEITRQQGVTVAVTECAEFSAITTMLDRRREGGWIATTLDGRHTGTGRTREKAAHDAHRQACDNCPGCE